MIYYEAPGVTLYKGSCLDILPQIPDNSIDMVFTSPPYNTGNSGKNKDMYVEYDDDLSDLDYKKLLDGSLNECLRVCRGAVFFNINYMNNNKYPLYYWIADHSGALRENIIWDKGTCQPPIGNILAKRYEYILMFTKDPKFQVNNFRENIAKGYEKYFGNWVSNLITMPADKENMGLAGTHRAGFPLDLPKIFIELYTKPGQTVLDPFNGMGSTIEAARSVGRHGIGIELCEKYCELTKERVSQGKLDI